MLVTFTESLRFVNNTVSKCRQGEWFIFISKVGTRISIRNTHRSLLCIAWLIHHTCPNVPRDPSNLTCFNTLVHPFFLSLIFFCIFATAAQSFTILLCVEKRSLEQIAWENVSQH